MYAFYLCFSKDGNVMERLTVIADEVCLILEYTLFRISFLLIVSNASIYLLFHLSAL